MEDVGAKCRFDGCHTVDFLPRTCLYCPGIFCEEHGHPDAHVCTREVVEVTPTKKRIKKRCQSPIKCRERLGLMPFVCKECDKSFCSKHRFPDAHQCENLEETLARFRIREPLPEPEPEPEPKAKKRLSPRSRAVRMRILSECYKMREPKDDDEEESPRKPLWTDALRDA